MSLSYEAYLIIIGSGVALWHDGLEKTIEYDDKAERRLLARKRYTI